MNTLGFEIFIVIFLILINGVFSMSEMAIVSSRKARLQQRADEGHRGSRIALELANNPSRFLSIIQIGITLISILVGAYGDATIGRELDKILSLIPFIAPYSNGLSMVIVIALITYITLIAGELIPKRIALTNAEYIAGLMAPLMKAVSVISSPLVHFLSITTEWSLRFMGIRQSQDLPVTEEEVKLMIEQGAQVGVFEATEQEMVERVFRLADQPVSAIMTPRMDVIWLDVNADTETLFETVSQHEFSHFPVIEDSPDNVIGMIFIRDLLGPVMRHEKVNLKKHLKPAQFIPESMSALEVLERFRKTGTHLALVIDEYGGFQGVVSIKDILEAIVGDLPIASEQSDPELVEREDGSLLVDGKMLVDDLKRHLEVKRLPHEEDGYYHTLGGLIMTHLGRIPVTGDYFDWHGYRFEVVDMDGRRVDKVLIAKQKSD